jgi:hypothetical protein
MATRKKKIRASGSGSGSSAPRGMNRHETLVYDLLASSGALAIVFHPDRGPHWLRELSFEILKKAIGGGYVQPVTLASGNMIVVDEEGLLKQLRLNPVLSAIASEQLGTPIVGSGVFVARAHKRLALK